MLFHTQRTHTTARDKAGLGGGRAQPLCTLLGGVSPTQPSATVLGGHRAVSLKGEHLHTQWPSNATHPGKRRAWKCSGQHRTQFFKRWGGKRKKNLETEMSLNGRADEKTGVFSHSKTLESRQNKPVLATCDINEPQQYYVNGKGNPRKLHIAWYPMKLKTIKIKYLLFRNTSNYNETV